MNIINLEAGLYMLKQIKDKLDLLLEANKGSISEVDFNYIKAYIDVLYHFAQGKDINDKEI